MIEVPPHENRLYIQYQSLVVPVNMFSDKSFNKKSNVVQIDQEFDISSNHNTHTSKNEGKGHLTFVKKMMFAFSNKIKTPEIHVTI